MIVFGLKQTIQSLQSKMGILWCYSSLCWWSHPYKQWHVINSSCKTVLESWIQDERDLGEFRYFFGIEVDRSSEGIFLSQRKYIDDLLKQYNMKQCRSLKLPMDYHIIKLLTNGGESLSRPEIYQRLVDKLIYLTITRPDISYTVHVLSQFMQHPTWLHFPAAKRVLSYLAGLSE